jgi:5-methylcytosine-specific restriction endonuclease McrA
MAISEVSIKKLWARSAGRCAFPGCPENCANFLAGSVEIIIGEMAHVIASSPSGPRGVSGGGSDDYENLVLLCPTHHRAVDKATKGTYSEEELHRWKAEIEKHVKEKFKFGR